MQLPAIQRRVKERQKEKKQSNTPTPRNHKRHSRGEERGCFDGYVKQDIPPSEGKKKGVQPSHTWTSPCIVLMSQHPSFPSSFHLWFRLFFPNSFPPYLHAFVLPLLSPFHHPPVMKKRERESEKGAKLLVSLTCPKNLHNLIKSSTWCEREIVWTTTLVIMFSWC